MPRFSSLTNQPTETRRVLRDRFKRYLPSAEITAQQPDKDITLDDELFLNLLLNLNITFKSEIKKARAFYNAHRPRNSCEPRLNELIDAGWLQVVWGRIWIPHDISQAARTAHATTMTAFIALLETRFEHAYHLTGSPNSDTRLAPVVSKMKKKQLTLRDIRCQTPSWVVARLWDRTLPHPDGNTAALRAWVDRWAELHYPTLQPGRVWTETAATAFFGAVFEVFETDRSLPGWDELRATFVRQLALITSRDLAAMESYVPTVPSSLVDRSLWLDNRSVATPAMNLLFGHEDFSGLVHLLLEEIGWEDHTPAPHKVAERLLALSIDRPGLFQIILRQIQTNPVLLADVLLYPATSALACLLVAQWPSSYGAWDRELLDRDNKAARAIAFADAASVMGHFLKQGTLDPAEAACLLVWFHEHARGGYMDEKATRESMLATLLTELARQPLDVLRAMAGMLTASPNDLRLGRPTFTAALDIIEVADLAADTQPTPLVNGYIQSIAGGDHILSADSMSTNGAATLVGLAMRDSPDLLQNFWDPIKISGRPATAADTFIEERTIARSIRAHIRVLSRAVVGWTERVPEALVLALVDTIRRGALRHAEKGRVAAFSPTYETNALVAPLDRPMAADIGAALGALTEDSRESLLTAVLETDEPLVLAQLLSTSPHATRERIKHRIAELTPSEAGEIYSLTDAQARIEALLSADLAEAAKQYIDAERDLQIWGQGPDIGRELARLRTTLRLNLLRGEWREIAETEPPSHLTGHQRDVAVETIDFYNAIAALKNPDGDRDAAEKDLARLQNRHPHVAAYVQNLFAARITLLLDGDFGLLRGAALGRGHRVLLEADELMLHAANVDDDVLEGFNCNKALLLLAIGRPEQALELLASQDANNFNSTVVAYRTVALARLDRRDEALAILDQAERTLGGADVFRAVREHIMSGKPFIANVDVSSTDDAVFRAKAVLFDFKQMDPNQQAEVLMPDPVPFSVFVSEQVRAAAASATSLVPMMKNVVIDSSEDDLSALIRELLTPRLQFLGWAVSDQSKGGHTAKGNPGERDLILKKDTTTLAVIEAVVCKEQIATSKLRQHFRKLFAYSECNLFFHLTYAYVQKPRRIWDTLKRIARDDSPDGFDFCEVQEISSTDSRPPGFTAVYRGDCGLVKVVFLVLDMGQYVQKNAATTATGEHKL